MALRGTLTHWKTRLLGQALGVAPCYALGLLEALWHVTAEIAPAGDVGRLSNKAIAMEMFYEGDPDQLIDALLESGHLNEHSKHRLIVHDWLEHAHDRNRHDPSFTKRRRRWIRMRAAGGDIGKTVRHAVMVKDGHACVTCDAKLDLTIDHEVPVSKGGTNAFINLQTLCRSCNSRKKDRVAL